MSQGTLRNIVQEAIKSKPAISLLEQMLKKSAVVGFDESGCYNNKKLNWAWIAQTAYITVFAPQAVLQKFLRANSTNL